MLLFIVAGKIDILSAVKKQVEEIEMTLVKNISSLVVSRKSLSVRIANNRYHF